MKKKILKLLQARFVKWILIPIALLILWAMSTLIYIINFDVAFTVLSYNNSKKDFISLNHDRLLAGDKIVGQFKAKENNLGIVSLRFRTFQRVGYESEDVFVFRIKEKGSKTWYSEQYYKSGLFFEVPFYPFGFKKIADSKNKIYVFELQSLHGNNYNAVEISEREPTLATKYQENKSYLLSDKKALINFTSKKFINDFQLFDVKFFSFIYLLPLIFYLSVLTQNQKRIKNKFLTQLLRLPLYFNFLMLLLLVLQIYYFDFKNSDTKFFSLIYILPLIFYFSVLAQNQKGLTNKFLSKFIKLPVYLDYLLLILLLLSLQIFYVDIKNDMMIFFILGIWITTVKKYNIKPITSLILAFLFLAICPFILIFKLDSTAEKAATWTFFFILVCVFQVLIENRKHQRMKATS